MKYYIVLYNLLNILTFVHNKKTPILRRNKITNGIETTILSKEMLTHITENFKENRAKEMQSEKNENCWMSLNAKQHFKIMDNIDERYRKVRSDFQKQLGEEFDEKMLNTLLKWRGVAQREMFKTSGKINLIPAGLNLGGYCMMKMKDSVLFFHRMKLRNQTHFRINLLHTDVENMVLMMQLSLNDLHLLGAYERSPTDKDPSVLYYAPTFGEVEFLLKNVDYKMEAQLRLSNNKLIIELITSKLNIEDILMMYMNKANYTTPIRLVKENIEDFLERMKTDLDKWLKDYFNDYLTYFDSLKTPSSEFMEAEKDKVIALNEYADSSLKIIKNRIRRLGADTVKIPHFTIYGHNQMKLQLKAGALWGLDSIYRRSVTTANKENDIRKVNLVVGFSKLKVMYKYVAALNVDVPPLTGIIVLSADDISAHMKLSLVKDPETVDLEFDFIQQMKPESLTVEGAASRMIANFKHLLEHHIIAIMSNAVIHSIKMLRTLSRCEPMLLSQHKSNNVLSLSNLNLYDNIFEEETDTDFQMSSESDSYYDISSTFNTKDSVSKDYTQNQSNDISSGDIPASESDKSSSQNINNDSNNLDQNEEDTSENSLSHDKSKEISSTNTSHLIKNNSYSQEDDAFSGSNSPQESGETGPVNNTNSNKDINNSEKNHDSEVENPNSENSNVTNDELSSEVENQSSDNVNITNNELSSEIENQSSDNVNITNNKLSSEVENQSSENVNITNNELSSEVENQNSENINVTNNKLSSEVENQNSEKVNQTSYELSSEVANKNSEDVYIKNNELSSEVENQNSKHVNKKNSELSSEVDNQNSENGNVQVNETTSNNDNIKKTEFRNIDNDFTLLRNDSLEFKLPRIDYLKGGKFKLYREEKMRLSRE